MAPALIALAAQIGAPLIEQILARKIGASNASLARDVIAAVAREAGSTPEAIDALAASDPARVTAAIQAVEPMTPEMIALYEKGLEGQFALAEAEVRSEHWFSWAWRPAGMWALGFLWLWNLVILHVANAVWRIALPPADLGVLFQLTATYMGLYMGGHTIKDVAAKWSSR